MDNIDTSSKNHLSIYYQNCRGIRTKLHTLYMNILSNNYDVIVLTETWLTDDIDNNEFIDQRYVVYRCDRDRSASNKQDGGGVLVAVLRGLRPALFDKVTTANASQSKHFEHILVEIPSANNIKKHLISAAYIPPRSSADVYEKHFDSLQECLINSLIDSFYIIGDYNIPDVIWSPYAPPSLDLNDDTKSTPLTGIGSTFTHSLLLNSIALLNASQYNGVYNENGKILDLFISNQRTIIQPSSDPLVPPDPHHPPFSALVNIPSVSKAMARLPMAKYNFYKADYDLINIKIKNTDWEALLQPLPVDSCLSTFYNTLDEIIKTHTPLSKSRVNGFPVWFSRSLIRTFRDKQKAWTKWKRFGNLIDYEKFSQLRSAFKKKCKQCHVTYLNTVEDSISKNVKHFWTYVSNLKSKPGIPSTMQYLNTKSNDPVTICNMFSSFFQSAFESSSPFLTQWEPPPKYCSRDILISSMSFTEGEISKELKNLDTSKGPGPDGLPPHFLKLTSGSICKPLYIIYNKCMTEGVFPKVWKCANITPVHKSGSRHNVEQYRPISILSTLSKVFERLVHNQVYPILHNVIISEQHGFVKQRSTTTNLLTFTNTLFETVDDGVQMDAVYTDFKKAFDKVDHELLLDKIAFNGIRGNLLRWFSSYILNRSQKVVINGYQSGSVSVTSGVPQGSILGPLLFIIFINDIKECFQNSKFLLYADDLKAYKPVKTIEDCVSFQNDLDKLSAYCVTNKLQLSIPKCHYVSFTKNKNVLHFDYKLCDTALVRVHDLRDLGIQLDSKLHLNIHVENIIKKAYRMYGFVMRSTLDFKRPSTYLYLYKTLIRSQLEYAVPIWNPYYKKYIEEIEKIQDKFLRAMHYRCYRTYSTRVPLLSKFNLIPLVARRKYLESVTLHKLVNNKFDCSELVSKICYSVPRTAHRREVRAGRLFAVCKSRTNTGMRVPIRRMMRSYNDSFHINDIDIFADNINHFKRSIIEKLSP
ncbi:hypothetical protein ABMA28_008995 [Loxostege sticticalis]|uniref:Reverse transcriptase domain-containing protein n=1 Tax=Loxostege sticticalis TaxID=481309 RepID=A0ABD0SGB2_LOXSC